MAQRDYVTKKKRPKKNSSRIIPNLMMAVAVILVVLFVAILYIVSSNKSNKPFVPPQDVTQRPQTILPDKPEERWTYLKELENPNGSNNTLIQEKERQQALDILSNDSPVKKIASVSTSDSIKTGLSSSITSSSVKETAQNIEKRDNWLLQCGAFKDETNAQSLKAKLAMTGVTSTIKSGSFYRVIAGPYSTKAEAEKTISSLKNNGISSCIAKTE